jgi:NADH:ubiquinone oxidoreductase subunit 3 (subunit A)
VLTIHKGVVINTLMIPDMIMEMIMVVVVLVGVGVKWEKGSLRWIHGAQGVEGTRGEHWC